MLRFPKSPFITRVLLVTILLSMQSMVSAQFYQGSNLTFGKNRIQHQEFLWQYYRFEKFDTYFYEGGKDIAAYVSEIAPEHISDLQNKLDYVLDDRIEFIIYNTQSDFRQSNLGMQGMEGDQQIGGSAQIVGTKVFIFHEGDRQSLIAKLREGIARIMLRDMLYGGDWKEVVKNSALLNLPKWYTEGLIAYLVSDWSPEMRDHIADGIRTGRYDKFNRLTDEESVYAGFSVWRYIGEVYGKSVIPNVLYMTQISRSIESGFVFVVGTPLDVLFQEYGIYYSSYFKQLPSDEEDQLEELGIRTKKTRSYSQFKLSPDGRQAALVSNELGQYRIHLFDIVKYRAKEKKRYAGYLKAKKSYEAKEKTKRGRNPEHRSVPYKEYRASVMSPKRIYKAEHKLNRLVDRSYPILEWNPRGTELAFVTESKGTNWLNIYSVEEKKVYPRELFGLDKVLAMDYNQNGSQLVFSGTNEGQTDLYRYYLVGNRQQQVTNDIYDDMEPRFARNDERIIFVSDRPVDTLLVDPERYPPMSTRDVYVIDLDDTEILERITDTPLLDERSPAPYDSMRYTYLANKGAMYDRYVANYDSVISRIDTTIHYRYFTETERLSNLDHHPLEYTVSSRGESYSLLQYEDGRYRFRLGERARDAVRTGELGSDATPVENAAHSDTRDREILAVDMSVPVLEKGVDIHNYTFKGEGEPKEDKPKPNKEEKPGPVIIEDIETILALQGKGLDTAKVALPKPRNYKLNFAVIKADLDVSNNFAFDFYQPYREGSNALTPGLSPGMEYGVADLFEDRQIVGSINMLGLTFQDFSYGIRYDNLSKRLDKAIIFQRQSQRFLEPRQNAIPRSKQVQTHIGRYKMSYPLNEILSIRSDFLGRYQREITSVRDDVSLRIPTEHSYLAGGKIEVILDNSLDRALNLRTGFRAKVWGEYYRTLDFDAGEYPDMGVVGFDIRQYQQIHRGIIAAFRVAGNSSFGQERILHFLGSVDNWVLPAPEFDASVPIDQGQNYVYQTLMLPMRGFFRNARNGTSAAVANAELRAPVFKYLLNRPIQSDFVENFQVVGFFDVGTAWTGTGPYSDSNTFNTIVSDIVDSGVSAVSIRIDNQEDPILAAYGFGLRSRLFGYFVRADWGWGIVDGLTLPAEFQLSLNLDF